MNDKKNSPKDNIHEGHRIRMKQMFLKHGFNAFTDIEKLEFLLYYAFAQKDTNPIAHKLLDTFGSIDKVFEAPYSELTKVEGIGSHAAILIKTILEFASSYGQSKCSSTIGSSESAKEFCTNLFKGKNVEEFYVICLATNNKVLDYKMISRGTASEVPINIRDITNLALANNCERIILAHNHPKGMARPSDEDISFTSRILYSCIINNIEVLDHIITSQQEAFSFEESKILSTLKYDAIRKIPLDAKTKAKFSQPSSNYKISNT